MGPLQRGLSPLEGSKVLRRALDLGVNFVDTAELYQTYEHIRLALQGFEGRQTVVVATSLRLTRRYVRGIERALQGLGLESIPSLCSMTESSHT